MGMRNQALFEPGLAGIVPPVPDAQSSTATPMPDAELGMNSADSLHDDLAHTQHIERSLFAANDDWNGEVDLERDRNRFVDSVQDRHVSHATHARGNDVPGFVPWHSEQGPKRDKSTPTGRAFHVANPRSWRGDVGASRGERTRARRQSALSEEHRPTQTPTTRRSRSVTRTLTRDTSASNVDSDSPDTILPTLIRTMTSQSRTPSTADFLEQLSTAVATKVVSILGPEEVPSPLFAVRSTVPTSNARSKSVGAERARDGKQPPTQHRTSIDNSVPAQVLPGPSANPRAVVDSGQISRSSTLELPSEHVADCEASLIRKNSETLAERKKGETGLAQSVRKVREAEEQTTFAFEKAKLANERAKAAESRAKAAEARAKDSDERAQRLAQQLSDAEQRATAAESRANRFDQLSVASSARAKLAESLVQAAESRVKDTDIRAQDAEIRAQDAERRAKEAENKVQVAMSQVATVDARVKEVENALQGKMTELEKERDEAREALERQSFAFEQLTAAHNRARAAEEAALSSLAAGDRQTQDRLLSVIEQSKVKVEEAEEKMREAEKRVAGIEREAERRLAEAEKREIRMKEELERAEFSAREMAAAHARARAGEEAALAALSGVENKSFERSKSMTEQLREGEARAVQRAQDAEEKLREVEERLREVEMRAMEIEMEMEAQVMAKERELEARVLFAEEAALRAEAGVLRAQEAIERRDIALRSVALASQRRYAENTGLWIQLNEVSDNLAYSEEYIAWMQLSAAAMASRAAPVNALPNSFAGSNMKDGGARPRSFLERKRNSNEPGSHWERFPE
ncbi:hypothetical protein HDU93_003788 [Gonapodya sp. JEL0774]|nr:hypothetical protein HDU93_003788 [Gonapodya sp. JEL0774]